VDADAGKSVAPAPDDRARAARFQPLQHPLARPALPVWVVELCTPGAAPSAAQSCAAQAEALPVAAAKPQSGRALEPAARQQRRLAAPLELRVA